MKSLQTKEALQNLALGLLLVSALVWVVSPMRFIQDLIPWAPVLLNYQVLVLGSSLLAAFCLFSTSLLWRTPSTRVLGTAPTTKSDSPSWVGCLLAAVFVALQIYTLDDPLIFDENYLGTIIAERPWAYYLTPFEIPKVPAPGQFLATSLAYFSSWLLGLESINLRIPFVVISSLFALLCATIFPRYLGRPTCLILLTHAIANQILFARFKMAAGYPCLILFTLILTILWKRICTETHSRKTLQLFALFSGLLYFSHTFSAIILCIFLLATLLWVSVHSKHLSSGQIRGIRYFCAFLVATLPISAFVLLRHYQLMKALNNFSTKAAFDIGAIAECFGLTWDWQFRTLALACGIILATAILRRGKVAINLYVCFSFAATVILAMMIFGLKVNYLAPRFFLVYLSPFIIAIAELTYQQMKKYPQVATATLFILFGLLPLSSRNSAYYSYVEPDFEFSYFLELSRKAIPAEACVSYEGDVTHINFARYLYLRNREDCRAQYGLRLPAYESDLKQLGPTYPSNEWNLVYQDGFGRTLFKRKPDTLKGKRVAIKQAYKGAAFWTASLHRPSLLSGTSPKTSTTRLGSIR